MKKALKIKPIIPLFVAIAFFNYPLSEMRKSYQLSKDGMIEEAQIIEYKPNILGGGGGRRFIEDFFIISYGGTTKTVLLGTRQAELDDSFEEMMKTPPHQEGERITVLYLPNNPDIMRVRPASHTAFIIYNTHEEAALLYLMKFIALLAIVSALVLFRKGKHASEEGK